MRFRPLAIVVLATLTLATVIGPAAARTPRAADRAVERELIGQLSPDVRVSRDRASGDVRALRGGRGPIATARSLGDPASPNAAARAFLGRYGRLVGVTAPGRQLRATGVVRAGRAGTYVRYQQQVDGVPVLGGDLVVVVDGRMNVQAVRGETTRDRTVDTRATVTSGAAMLAARQAVARATGVPVGGLRAAAPRRWVFDPRLLGAPGLPFARLVWRTAVTDPAGRLDWFVAVDAHSGDAVLTFDQQPEALPVNASQRLCDQQNKRQNVLKRLPCRSVDAINAATVLDASKAKAATEAAYDFYRLRFGYDLAGELGGTLVSTVRYCPAPAGGDCPYQNAFWNGSQMVYGAGFAAADDVVGHELTHGVTERTSNLYYYMQSGALNEALSDIFGESIDLTDVLDFDTDTEAARWKIGEDLPSIGVIRNMKDPTIFGHPDRVDSPLWDDDPAELDGGGVHSNSGVANKAFYLMVEGPHALDADRDVALDKALAIWFLAASTLLTSASDYDDLASALGIACDQLAGVAGAVKTRTGAASADIEPFDCSPSGAVASAIDATDMSWQKRNGDGAPVPLCSDSEATQTFLLDDPITSLGNGWTFDTPDSNRRWSTWDIYGYPAAGSPPGTAPWHLFGADLGRTGDRRIRRTGSVTIPATDRPVFLWFRHAYGFDDGSEDLDPNNRAYDGGVVEVSANGGPWVDIGPLFVSGGPTRKLYAGYGNPLKGRIAYGAESGGYVTARANLSGYPGLSFKGKNVRLSFRIGTDDSYAGEGWFIDDVRIYQCVNEADSSAPDVHGLSTELGGAATVDAAGRVPTILRAGATMDPGAGTGVVSVRLGSGLETDVVGELGLGGFNWNTTVPLKPSTLLQHVRMTVTDENGDAGDAVVDTRLRAFQDPAFTAGSGWTTRSRSSAWGGTVRSSSQAGRTATLTVTGRSIAPVLTAGPDKGKARICVGDDCRVVNLYTAKATPRRFATTWNFETSASRTLRITALGTKDGRSSGKAVEIDGVAVLQD